MSSPDLSAARVTPTDNANHTPSKDEWWQESVLFMWGDPRSGFGGEIRFGRHPNRGAANVYLFIVIDGRRVVRKLSVDLPPPSIDLLESTLAGVTLHTIEPLSKFEVTVSLVGLKLDMRWESFHAPRTFDMNVGGATLATGHYNSIGRMTGRGVHSGNVFDIDACGFSDHSWGVRRHHVPASRFVVAVFDPEFYILAMPILTDSGAHMLGYVRDLGRFDRLVGPVDMGFSFRDDWFTPSACDATLTTEEGRMFRLRGRSVGDSSTQPMGHGKLVTHAIGAFECRGQSGKGIIESSLPRRMPAAQVAELGLAPDSWWVNEAPEHG